MNKYDPGTVPVRGMYEGVSGAGVYLRFPATGLVTKLVPVGETKEIKYTIIAPDGEEKLVTETYNWEIPVPRELLTAEASFQAVAKIIPDPARPENAFEWPRAINWPISLESTCSFLLPVHQVSRR